MKRFLRSVINFLIDSEILEGVIFCFVFGTSLALPFAVVIGLGTLSEAAAIAFAGFIIGGLFTVGGAWLTAWLQMGEYHRKEENAIDDLQKGMQEVSNALQASTVFLSSTRDGQFAEVIGPPGGNGAVLAAFKEVLPNLVFDNASFDALPRTTRRLSIELRSEARHIATAFDDLLNRLEAWSNNRNDRAIASQIVERSMQMDRAVIHAIGVLEKLRTEFGK